MFKDLMKRKDYTDDGAFDWVLQKRAEAKARKEKVGDKSKSKGSTLKSTDLRMDMEDSKVYRERRREKARKHKAREKKGLLF